MGKLEEGTFSLDFHELSPFQVNKSSACVRWSCEMLTSSLKPRFMQAFVIAMAAFDQ